MKLGSLDPALTCSGAMSTFSYDSHPVSRGQRGHMMDELPRVYQTETKPESDYDLHEMDLEIQRVARELYKAFNGLNTGFKEPSDQIVIDELSSHTDTNRQQLIHPYKTIYGRNLNNVLKDNLGSSWEEACSTLMCEMRMYELECLRRRMEDEMLASQQVAEVQEASSSQLMSPLSGSCRKNGNVCSSELSPLSPSSEPQTGAPSQEFSGISCLLITWKSNPEVEQFKELYWTESCKDKKKRTKLKTNLSEMVSEDSLKKHYRVLGKGDGIERLLVKGKKEELDEVDGDSYKYFLLAGTSHPYPDDTFYSVGRVPRKLLMKYLGIKMYLVRLRQPAPTTQEDWLNKQCREQADLAMVCAGILSPVSRRRLQQ